MKTQTRQKEEASNSFKAPSLAERGLTTHNSTGAIIHQKEMIRKKPRSIKELKEEFK